MYTKCVEIETHVNPTFLIRAIIQVSVLSEFKGIVAVSNEETF